MKQTILVYALSMLVAWGAKSANVKGTVYDESNEPLIGATVVVSQSIYSIVGLDGGYTLKNLPVGTHQITVSYMGFQTIVKKVVIESASETKIINFILKSDEALLDEVVITAKATKGSIADARLTERNSNTVMNVVSAKTIELSTDLSVANVVQRISGVTVQRSSNGSPQFAVIRGMDKRYNYTLVNGIKIPSPDNENRYVPLDIFPSDIVEDVQVRKSLDATMEADAIGGAINMNLKSAPEAFMLNVNAQLGINMLFADRKFNSFNTDDISYKTPAEVYGEGYAAELTDFNYNHGDIQPKSMQPDLLGGFTVGNRFLNNKLGLIVSGSAQNTYRGSDETRSIMGISNDGKTEPVIIERHQRFYSDNQKRYAFHAQLDYAFNPSHQLKVYGANFNLINDQVRDVRAIDIYNSSGKLDEDATLKYFTRFRKTNQTIRIASLDGDHGFVGDRLKLDWKVVYAKAGRERPDVIRFVRDGSLVKKKEQPQLIALNNRRVWELSSDEDKSAYINLAFAPDFLPNESKFKLGGMVRNKDRDNVFMRYNFNPDPIRQKKEIDWSVYKDVKWQLINPAGTLSDERNNKQIENVHSAYIQSELDFGKLGWNVGVRAEHTEVGYQLKFDKSLSNDTTYSYVDYLPSTSFKYAINDKSNLRLSYYKAISRPGYYEIIPYLDTSDEHTYGISGNPSLRRIKAHNIGLRYELFPKVQDQLLLGVFYKDIKDPIEYNLVKKGGARISQPINIASATNYGFELDFNKFFNKFGVRLNYTFTQSSVTTTKLISERKDVNDPTSGVVQKEVQQTRPLQGQAKHIANLSVLYKNQKAGLDVQLAAIYTGEKIAFVSEFLNNDILDDDFINLDLSIDKQFLENRLTVSFKAQNITNSKLKRIIHLEGNEDEEVDPLQVSGDGQTVAGRAVFKPSFRIGVKYKIFK